MQVPIVSTPILPTNAPYYQYELFAASVITGMKVVPPSLLTTMQRVVEEGRVGSLLLYDCWE
jgi:hypothetical protein